MQVKKQG